MGNAAMGTAVKAARARRGILRGDQLRPLPTPRGGGRGDTSRADELGTRSELEL
jgi:hypothetical protein